MFKKHGFQENLLYFCKIKHGHNMKNLPFIVVLLVIFSCERIDFNDFEKGMDEETEVEDIPFLLDETFADSTKWNDCDEDVEMNRGKT